VTKASDSGRKNSADIKSRSSTLIKSPKNDTASKKSEKKEEEDDSDSEIIQNSGTFSIDDPLKILDHAILDDSGHKLADTTKNTSLNQVYFEVEWQKRKDGTDPGPTYYTYTVLKKNCPSLILDYIENMVHFD